MRQMGVVKYYNRERGAGVVTLADGRDAFLQARRLAEEQREMIVEDVQMEFEVAQGAKGLEVIGILG
ncbi:MAG TPA: hypothetical protein VF574_15190 [Allosphingosinicella sp.]|jgi:cold shock CspA family protein